MSATRTLNAEENEQFDKLLKNDATYSGRNVEELDQQNTNPLCTVYRDDIKADKSKTLKEPSNVLYGKRINPHDMLEEDIRTLSTCDKVREERIQILDCKQRTYNNGESVVRVSEGKQFKAINSSDVQTDNTGKTCEDQNHANVAVDCEKGIPFDQKHLTDCAKGTGHHQKPSKFQQCQQCSVWVVAVVALILSCLAFWNSKHIPIRQTSRIVQQIQSVKLPLNWNLTKHLLPNLSWSSPNADSLLGSFMNIDHHGIRITIEENAMYEVYLHLLIDSSNVDFSKRKSRTVGSTICLKSNKGVEVCDRHTLLPGTADSVAFKSTVDLQQGDYLVVISHGVNLFYSNNAGNYLTITKFSYFK